MLITVLAASVCLFFGCTQPETSNANTAPPTQPEQAKEVTPPFPELPANIEPKPEPKKYGVLTADPENLRASFEIKGAMKGDVYETTYASKQNGKKEVIITILSREGEITAVFLRLLPIAKVAFMVQAEPKNPDKAALDSKGVVKATRDANVVRCLKGAQKIVGAYERDLKAPPESVLIKFWLNDCGSLPLGLLAPVSEGDIQSTIDDLDI